MLLLLSSFWPLRSLSSMVETFPPLFGYDFLMTEIAGLVCCPSRTLFLTCMRCSTPRCDAILGSVRLFLPSFCCFAPELWMRFPLFLKKRVFPKAFHNHGYAVLLAMGLNLSLTESSLQASVSLVYSQLKCAALKSPT